MPQHIDPTQTQFQTIRGPGPGAPQTAPFQKLGSETTGFFAGIRDTVLIDTGFGQTIINLATAQAQGIPSLSVYRRIKPGYNVFRDEDLSGYEPFISEFEDVHSPEEAWFVKQMIDNSVDLRQSMESIGFGRRMLGNLFDPINILPLPLAKGAGFLKGFQISATAAMGGFIPSELIRHKIDPTATPQELMFSILGGVVFSGLLGGGAGMYKPGPNAIPASVILRLGAAALPPAPPHGQLGMFAGIPAFFGTGDGMFRRMRAVLQSAANQGDAATRHASVKKPVTKAGKPVNKKDAGPLDDIGGRVKADWYPSRYESNGPSQAKTNLDNSRIELDSLRLRAKNEQHIQERADDSGMEVVEVRKQLNQTVKEFEADLKKADEFFAREDVQKQMTLESEAGIPDRPKPTTPEELAQVEIISKMDEVGTSYRADLREYRGIRDNMLKELSVLKKMVGKLKIKVGIAKGKSAKTKARNRLFIAQEKLSLLEGHHLVRITSRIADATVSLSNFLGRKLVDDFDIYGGIPGMHTVAAKTGQWPWWSLLKNDFRRNGGSIKGFEEFGVELQKFGMRMSATPGLNNRAGALGVTIQSVESKSIIWQGVYLKAQEIKRTAYSEHLGLSGTIGVGRNIAMGMAEKAGETVGRIKNDYRAARNRQVDKSDNAESVANPEADAPSDKLTVEQFDTAVFYAIANAGKYVGQKADGAASHVEKAAKGYMDMFKQFGREGRDLGVFASQQNFVRKLSDIDRMIKDTEASLKNLGRQKGDSDLTAKAKFDEENLLRDFQDQLDLERMEVERMAEAYKRADSGPFGQGSFIHRIWLPDFVKTETRALKDLIRKSFLKNNEARIGDTWFKTTDGPLALEARVDEAYSSIQREAELGGDADFRLSSRDKREWLVARLAEMNKAIEGTALARSPTRNDINKGADTKDADAMSIARNKALGDTRTLTKEVTEPLDLSFVSVDRTSTVKLEGEELIAANPAVIAFYRKETIEAKLDRIEKGEPIVGNAGPLISRTLDLDDADLARLGVIETNIDAVAGHYSSRMGTVIEMAREFGDINASQEINRIIIAANNKALGLPIDEQVAMLEKIAKSQRDMQDLRDIRLGIYQIPDNPMAWGNRMLRMVRQFSILTSMGKSQQMAMADVGAMVLSQGFERSFRHLIRRMTNKINDPKNPIFMLDQEAINAGTVTEVLMSTRVAQWAETGSQFYASNAIERTISNASNRMFLLNMLAPWTDMMRKTVGGLASSELVKLSVKWAKDGKLGKEDLDVMTRLGINKEQAKQIEWEWRKSGSLKIDDLYIANSEQWVSDNARRAFRAGINTEVNTAVPTPGDVDKPKLLLKSEWGKIVGQYRGFSLGATNRIMNAGMGKPAAKKYSGFASMIVTAMLVDSLLKRPDYMKMPIEEQIFRGIELSGATGILLDANDALERASRGDFGLRNVFGYQMRERDPSWASQLGVIGAVPDQWLGLVWAMSSKDAETSDVARTIRYLIPWNNVMWWSGAVSRIQRSVVDNIEEE